MPAHTQRVARARLTQNGIGFGVEALAPHKTASIGPVSRVVATLLKASMTVETPSPLSAYLEKLERRRDLFPDERAALLALPAVVRRAEAQERIIGEDEAAEQSVFLIQGLVSRQKRAGGSYQIISLGFPGDGVDLQTLFFDETDHALVAHEATIVALVPHGALIELCDGYPHLSKMLWHDTLVDSAIFREWAMNIGHRRAPLRVGALILECEARLAAIGRVHDGTFELKLTQQELASALGLSQVHFNKSLRRLREEKLIATSGRQIRIRDREALAKMVGFDPGYLHLGKSPRFEKAGATQALSPHRPSSVNVAV